MGGASAIPFPSSHTGQGRPTSLGANGFPQNQHGVVCVLPGVRRPRSALSMRRSARSARSDGVVMASSMAAIASAVRSDALRWSS